MALQGKLAGAGVALVRQASAFLGGYDGKSERAVFEKLMPKNKAKGSKGAGAPQAPAPH